MPKSEARKFVRTLKDTDDLVKLITGKRVHQLVARGIELFGDDIKGAARSQLLGQEPELPMSSPYRVLGVRPDASDIVVKASYRALARDCHPDTATKPNPERFQTLTEAYNAIIALRKGQKG